MDGNRSGKEEKEEGGEGGGREGSCLFSVVVITNDRSAVSA